MCKSLGYIQTLATTVISINTDYKAYIDELNKIEALQQDLLHQIENTDKPRVCDGYKLTMKLQEARRKRRDIKMELELLQIIEPFARQMQNNIQQLSANVKKKNQQLQRQKEEKIYVSRVGVLEKKE
jgi:uncharacterized protein (DUF3084 family)